MTEPQEAAPLRPVSEDHRHEPADYEALKPCPFCGGEPFAYFGKGMGWAQCRESNKCSVHPVTCADTEAEAREAWNQRTALSQAPRSCWRPIETAPKDGTEIIGFRPDQGVFAFRWADADEMGVLFPGEDVPDFEWWWHDRWGWMEGELTPTHWQPLPEPPATDDVAAPRSCCAEERERCAKIADAAIKTAAIADPQSVASPGDCAAVACTAIRSNSHDG